MYSVTFVSVPCCYISECTCILYEYEMWNTVKNEQIASRCYNMYITVQPT